MKKSLSPYSNKTCYLACCLVWGAVLASSSWMMMMSEVSAFSRSTASRTNRRFGRQTTPETTSASAGICNREIYDSSTRLEAKKKGFGSTSSPKRKPEPSTTATASSSSSTPTTTSNPPPAPNPSSTTSPPPPQNAGQRALADMRRQRAEQKDAELRQVRNMLQADDQVNAGGPAAIPEVVAQRMGKRMLPFVGLPFFGGLSAFVAFWYMATYRNIEYQPALVAFSTIAILLSSLLGITYSVMSASWDEDREGDFWGIDEFKRNVQNVREGLQRSRDNVLLRENVARLGDDEVQSALQDLEKREKKAVAPKTLSEKLKQDGLDGE